MELLISNNCINNSQAGSNHTAIADCIIWQQDYLKQNDITESWLPYRRTIASTENEKAFLDMSA